MCECLHKGNFPLISSHFVLWNKLSPAFGRSEKCPARHIVISGGGSDDCLIDTSVEIVKKDEVEKGLQILCVF